MKAGGSWGLGKSTRCGSMEKQYNVNTQAQWGSSYQGHPLGVCHRLSRLHKKTTKDQDRTKKKKDEKS